MEFIEEGNYCEGEGGSRKERIKRKIENRKNKKESDSDSNVPGKTHWITREQRIHKTKLRNRQSAQRSRQQRKMYILKLQHDISQLRSDRDRLQGELTQLSQTKLCQKCQAHVFVNTLMSDEMAGPRISSENSPDEVSYRRILGEEGSKLPMFLFVCLVVVSLFIFKVDDNTRGRENQVEVLADAGRMGLVAYVKQDECLTEYLAMRYPNTNSHLKTSSNSDISQPPPPPPTDVLFCRFPHLARFNKTYTYLTANKLQILLQGHQLNISDMSAPLDPIVPFRPEINSNNLYMLQVDVRQVSSSSNFKCVQ